MTVPADTQQKIQQLQALEQNMQQIHMQKQQLQNSIFEFENALKELEDAPQAYKIIGTVMVSSSKEKLQKDLREKKELSEVRLGSLEKQETQLRDKAKELQEQVISSMK